MDTYWYWLMQQLAAIHMQVLLRWGIQQGCAVIPKSVHPQYVEQYGPQQLLTWQLSSGDMAALDELEDGHKYCWDASDIC
jgi:diketogulonate reductase-like aldo/keto reductase